MKCGIVDVGSNTIRLSIYHWEGQTFKLLMNKKEMAGLAGYIKNGVLSDSGILVACRVLAGFKALLRNFDIDQLYVFGTASLRNIVNTEEALETIQAVTGLQVEVLSGAEEASFSFLGATVGGGAPGCGLLADIGGGSTELVTYRDGAITSGCSLPMGSLSLFTKYVSGLFPTKEERKAIRAQVEEELEKARIAGLRCRHLTGVGGTIRAAAKLCNDLSGADPDNRIIPVGEIRSLYKDLKKGDRDTLRQILRSVPDRVHTILPGLAILTAVLRAYQVETVSVSTCGVREGYLLNRVIGVNNQHDEGN
ncbi:Ppx/GppA phosphatase family protein [Intestinimonas massiliensis (ex Afouda et al. 2020)]|uniref:Ppx/GppA phosphatase family protein n=1 Tax=Intestinimonas massiliensis (ex Afouda et al. 2020) TaxID=1673721 RepID=UPI0010317B50|nr:phosphatase [Intestinimonas massiliensis (ex Afouda et al. 2020)]